MDQYDSNVQVVMDFLVDENYNKSTISVHRVCYRELQKYLLECSCEYSQKIGNEWQTLHERNWPKWRIKTNRVCLMQLNDVYELGCPRKYHPYAHPVWFGQLSSRLREELDRYMFHFNSTDESYRRTVQMECSDFLLFIQFRGKNSITKIDYDDVTTYYFRETDRMESTKSLYISQARGLLSFYASQGLVKNSLYLRMNKLFIHQIVLTKTFFQ